MMTRLEQDNQAREREKYFLRPKISVANLVLDYYKFYTSSTTLILRQREYYTILFDCLGTLIIYRQIYNRPRELNEATLTVFSSKAAGHQAVVFSSMMAYQSLQ